MNAIGGGSTGGHPGHLVLVGMTGVGKSSVGRLLAERVGRQHLDSDAEIERRDGRSVREIFAHEGEPAFRALEASVMHDALTASAPLVISTGGGVVLDPDTRAALGDPAHRVVWLTADLPVLVERVKMGRHRPLLDEDPLTVLNQMWSTREGLYREVADVIVTVEGRSVSEVVEAILR